MFGYVNIFKPELKVKDYSKYRAYYCGLCKVLQQKYGLVGKMTLSYDMTFLIILLSSLYEPETRHDKYKCMVHPIEKREMLFNEITEYAASMNIVLTYYKFIDDWKDDKNKMAMVGIRTLRKSFVEISRQYPDKCKAIKRYLDMLSKTEKADRDNIGKSNTGKFNTDTSNKDSCNSSQSDTISLDDVSRYFGELMGELFSYKADEWSETLRRVGFYLGKFIYLMDAFDDLEEDIESNSYNPLKTIYNKAESKEMYVKQCADMLELMMADCTSEFEKLPCVDNIDILKNILYVGVWNKYEKKLIEDKGRKEND